jgi:hypothetical protein
MFSYYQLILGINHLILRVPTVSTITAMPSTILKPTSEHFMHWGVKDPVKSAFQLLWFTPQP